jgi:hypothetical protein
MATSGSYDYLVTAGDVIIDALENIAVYDPGETLSAEDQATCLRSLNFLAKQWQGANDYSPGLKTWSLKRGFLFLQKDQHEYALGPTGDHATLEYVTTTLSGAEAAGQTALSVTSISGITAADYIGIELDDGSLHWSTVNGAPSGATVTIADALPSSASSGNRVFAYTTKLMRPLHIRSISLRNSDSSDWGLRILRNTEDYDKIPDKGAEGDPGSIYYQQNIPNGLLFTNSDPNDVTQVLSFTFVAPSEDYDSASDDIAYPQVWFLALSWGLAKIMAPKFKVPWTPDLEDIYKESTAIARNADPDTSSLYFQPYLE